MTPMRSIVLATAVLLIGGATRANGLQQQEETATRVGDSVYAVFGGSNAYLVKTPAGNVLIDSCNPVDSPECFQILTG